MKDERKHTNTEINTKALDRAHRQVSCVLARVVAQANVKRIVPSSCQRASVHSISVVFKHFVLSLVTLGS